ncbi:DUF4129 domain-containing protein [Aquibacillus kalidii]|uniref:DUF4129 domain-containing protein n=1 Tax=Aquibacillus kalidii TaxID=2762597 RepID=UPI001C99035F|nr:DUF4129 domain-containing protein [Aquibacillus kalidii]
MVQLNNEEAKQQLESILNKQEYQAYYKNHESFIGMWWDRAKEWIGDLLSDWFRSFEPTSGVSEGILMIIVIVAICLILLLVVYLWKNVSRARKFRASPIQTLHEMDWTYERHITEAEKYEEKGNYTLASRHMFLALLLFLHEKEWLEAKIWKTNWDYYEELSKRDRSQAEQFFELTLLFDEATYGERNIERDEHQRYRSSILNLFIHNPRINQQGQVD